MSRAAEAPAAAAAVAGCLPLARSSLLDHAPRRVKKWLRGRGGEADIWHRVASPSSQEQQDRSLKGAGTRSNSPHPQASRAGRADLRAHGAVHRPRLKLGQEGVEDAQALLQQREGHRLEGERGSASSARVKPAKLPLLLSVVQLCRS